jgi:hypothetical protein
MLKILCLAILSFLVFSVQSQEAKAAFLGSERILERPSSPLKVCGIVDSLFGDDFLAKKIILSNISRESIAVEWRALCVDELVSGKNKNSFHASKHEIKSLGFDTLEVFFKKCCGDCSIPLIFSNSQGAWEVKIKIDQYSLSDTLVSFYKY